MGFSNNRIIDWGVKEGYRVINHQSSIIRLSPSSPSSPKLENRVPQITSFFSVPRKLKNCSGHLGKSKSAYPITTLPYNFL